MVTWDIRGVGCFRDSRRSPAVGRMVVNLKGVKNAVMKCFRQARKLGYKMFAMRNGGKCFAGARGHLTYSKYGRSRGCRKGLGGSSAINVYRFTKCKWSRQKYSFVVVFFSCLLQVLFCEFLPLIPLTLPIIPQVLEDAVLAPNLSDLSRGRYPYPGPQEEVRLKHFIAPNIYTQSSRNMPRMSRRPVRL